MQKLFFFLFGILFFTACDDSRIYEEHESFSDIKWGRSETVTFKVDIEDTTQRYDEIIAIRHGERYPFKNLRVKVTKKTPSGKTSEENHNLILTDEDKMWKGSGMGDIYDLEMPLQENLSFTETGTYTYTYTHTMQHEELPLIMEVGLALQKVE